MHKYLLLFLSFLFSICLNAQTPGLNDSLVVYYPLDGNSLDLSGNDHHGVINGATPIANRFGLNDMAMNFDGTNQFIDCGDILNISEQDGMTIAAWFYPRIISSQGNRYVGISFGTKIAGEMVLRITSESLQTMQSLLRSGSNIGTNNNANSALSPFIGYDQWIHAAATFKNGLVELYLNGSITAVNSTTNGNGAFLTDIQDTAVLRIGKAFNTNNDERYFNGIIDEVYIYNRVLSPSEIDSLYNGFVFTSIEDNVNNRLRLYPNPANRQLVISGQIFNQPQVKIIDINGKILDLPFVFNKRELRLNIDQLTTGMYTVIIIDKDKVYKKRFLKHNDFKRLKR